MTTRSQSASVSSGGLFSSPTSSNQKLLVVIGGGRSGGCRAHRCQLGLGNAGCLVGFHQLGLALLQLLAERVHVETSLASLAEQALHALLLLLDMVLDLLLEHLDLGVEKVVALAVAGL